MKTVMISMILALVMMACLVAPTEAVDLEPLRGVYDPCELCSTGFWVHCWACAMWFAWESGEPWGWWA